MSTFDSRPEDSRPARPVRDLTLGLPPLVLVAAGAGAALELPGVFPVQAVALYLGAALLILFGVPDGLRGPGLGIANRVTLGRLLLVLPLAALALQPEVASETTRWWVVGMGAVALALDGVDGWVARRTGTGSAFGARFDMETDAFLILVLSVLAWRAGPVGPWILWIGALRYLFVAAGTVWPALRRELPPSLRRKTVCVVQGIALLVCVGPVVPPPLAVAVGAGALAALAGSFAVDVLWALGEHPTPGGDTPAPAPSLPGAGSPLRPGPEPSAALPGDGPVLGYRVRTRIRPSWATEATTSPSRLK